MATPEWLAVIKHGLPDALIGMVYGVLAYYVSEKNGPAVQKLLEKIGISVKVETASTIMLFFLILAYAVLLI